MGPSAGNEAAGLTPFCLDSQSGSSFVGVGDGGMVSARSLPLLLFTGRGYAVDSSAEAAVLYLRVRGLL